MSSVYTGNLTVSIFGQSHAPAIGVTIDGLPAGFPINLDELQFFLSRRAPGQNAWSTPRREVDAPEVLCGLKNGKTCGAPLTAIIRNTNTRSGDYENLKDVPRPGHADYTAQVKFGGAQDASGGGHFSGRLTAPMCIAGGICMQLLEHEGVRIRARILSIGTVTDSAPFDAPVAGKPFPAPRCPWRSRPVRATSLRRCGARGPWPRPRSCRPRCLRQAPRGRRGSGAADSS